jgi:serine carboxypeptidase-like clade 2
MSLLIKILALALIGLALSDDRVYNLPDYPYSGPLYSGYLKLKDPRKQLHYLFLESQSNPREDPVVLWLNGGPGCSSLLGWAQEHGPASFGEDSDKFGLNPYSWNKEANVIYLESPTNVGFSVNTSQNPDDLYTDDIVSGQENLQAMIEFFRKYPSFKNNDFYISGESYAGIYVPTLAWNIVNYNKSVVASQRIQLRGILVGNGVTDWSVDTQPATIELGFNHALFSPEAKTKYDTVCANPKAKECNDYKDQLEEIVGNTVNIYDIYRKCNRPHTFEENGEGRKPFNYTPWLHRGNKFKDTPPCTDSKGPDTYFNRLDVKLLLNVNPEIKWSMCSDSVYRNYNRGTLGSYYLYQPLIQSGVRILIYSGDTDGAVPFNGTQKWINNLGLPVEKPWRSWRINDTEVAGYITNYTGLTFVTVKGTGHMVPQWKPAEAYHMYSKFLKGQDL